MSKRKDGLYEIKRTVTQSDGTKKERSFYGVNKKAAIKSYEEYLIDQQKYDAKRSIVYFNEVADSWLSEQESAVQPYTYRGYKYKVEEMKIQFQNLLIDQIKPKDLQRYLNDKRNQSENTVKKYKIYLNAIFNHAMVNFGLKENPMRDVKMPKCRQPKELHWYTKNQARTIVEYAKMQGLKGLSAFFPLKTGLRAGEVIAFNPPRDIDYKNKTLTVNETVKVADEKKTGDPKTKTSIRTIPVDDEFLEHIKSFKFTGYIYDNGKGEPINYTNWLNHYFEPFMNSLPDAIPRYNPHELRHTHGTLLYEAGTDLYTIMKLMGHANIAVTQVYVHQSVDTIRDKVKSPF